MTRDELKQVLECLMLVSDRPLSRPRLAEAVPDAAAGEIEGAIEELREDYRRRGSGLQIVEVAGGGHFATRAEAAPAIRRMLKSKLSVRLSPPARETLAIVAYNQPISRSEVEAKRGVDSGHVMNKLLGRRLIKIAGRRETVGRPLVYVTTDDFLRYFGLKDLSELPALEELAPPETDQVAADASQMEADLPVGPPALPDSDTPTES